MDNTVPNVDPILVLYVPMTKKVKEEGYEGAISVLENIQDLYLASDEGTKRALLELVNRLVFDGGAPFHKALIDAGILTLFANNSIDEIAKLIPVYFGDWKSVMNPEYGYILDDSVSLLENQQAGRFAGLTQKPRPGSVGQFKIRPINPLIPFYTMLYFRAQRILSIARGFSIFHMLSIHIARQALHLVVLLNDLAYAEDGLNSEQRRERIALEDELIDLEDAMKSWNSVSNMRDASSYDEYFSEIKEWYGRIFRLRFYFPFTRDPLHDEVFEKLLSCDKRTLSFREHCIRIQPVDIRAELEELGKDAIGIESALEKGKEPSVEVFETAKVSLTMAEIDLFRGEPTTLREYLENEYAETHRLEDISIRARELSLIACGFSKLYHDKHETEDLERAIIIYEEAISATDSRYAEYASALGSILQERFRLKGDRADINRAVTLYQDAVKFTSDADEGMSKLLISLGNCYTSRFDRFGEADDINEAISIWTRTAPRMQEGDPDQIVVLMNLISSWEKRFDRYGGLYDLTRIIAFQQSQVDNMPDGHPVKPLWLTHLGNSFQSRFMCLGDIEDMKKAISLQQLAANLTPDGHVSKPTILNNLGSSARLRFERLGDIKDLEEAISLQQSALDLMPEGHDTKPTTLSNLGNSFELRFRRFWEIKDLEEAISFRQAAINLTPDGRPDKPAILSNLGSSIRARFKHRGDVNDLQRSLSFTQAALDLMPDNHRDKPSILKNLGDSIRDRFTHLGDFTDLERSISLYQEAVDLTPAGHPDKPGRLINLADSFRLRFKNFGDTTDLERLFALNEEAVNIIPEGHPDKPTGLNNVGGAVQLRFERLGDVIDLENAISLLQAAVDLTPDGHPDKPSRLNNLGVAVQTRFERLGDVIDLENAISLLQAAGDLMPDGHPDKPSLLNNIGSAVQLRFERLGDVIDLENAISLLQAAVDLTPDGHLDKPSRLNNLGGAVQLRFERLRDVIDLENAISFLQAAVDLTPDGHPDKPGFLSNLGDIFLCRFRVTNHPTDLQSAICSYSTSANSPCGPSIIRFRTAAAWARTSHLYGQYPLTAFECVMTLLPQVAWLGSSLRNQRAHLTEPGDVVRYAVAVAIELQEYETAVRWAEHGRSIIWQNLLSLRNPMDDLHKSHSELAIRLKHVSQQLQGSLYSHGDLEKSESDLLQDISNKASILAAERDKIVEQVRQLPGFEYFLKAKSFDTLAAAAYEGPVAIINVSERRCDALVLIPHDSQTPDVSIVHIPLESFSHAMSEKLFREFNRLLSSAGVTRKSERESLVRDKEGSFKSILHPIWLHVVKPILDGLAYQPGNQSRIWWCVTGPLAFLPIHAAGNYETDVVGEKISDYVVSSYTPTLTAILDQSQPEVTEHFQILTVAQPSTPHAPPLPETEREVNHVKDIAGDLCVKNLINEEATAARVMQAMKESNWIHLACHGLKHESDPLKSGFLLHDRTLELSELIQEPLPKADFAFLSSCCGNGRNPNFAKDLVPWTAGVLFLGFKGMIGTAWSIQDEDGPKVTKAVYERMLKDGKPNRKEAARALHEAVKELRESGADFLSWVPFIHIGR